MDSGADLTAWLHRWAAGEAVALDAVVSSAYSDLKRLAEAHLRNESRGQTIQATALVHEVYLRLCRERGTSLESRAHFFSLSAMWMRRILVDRARSNAAHKRRHIPVPLHPDLAWVDASGTQIADFDRALDELAKQHPAVANTAQLKFVLGMTAQEIVDVLAISRTSVDRHLRFAKAWLFDRLQPVAPA